VKGSLEGESGGGRGVITSYRARFVGCKHDVIALCQGGNITLSLCFQGGNAALSLCFQVRNATL